MRLRVEFIKRDVLLLGQDDDGVRGDRAASAIEAAKALAERVETGAFRDQRVEIEVCTDFKALRGDDDLQRTLRLGFGIGLHRFQNLAESLRDGIPIQRAHPPEQQLDLRDGLAFLHQRVDGARGRDAVDHDGDGARRVVFDDRRGLRFQHLREFVIPSLSFGFRRGNELRNLRAGEPRFEHAVLAVFVAEFQFLRV